MKRVFVTVVLMLLAVGCGPGGRGLGALHRRADLSVMTRNLYYGAEFAPVLEAFLFGDEEDVVLAVTEVWGRLLAADFPTRAEAIAEEIRLAGPQVVGLQEVALLRRGPYDPDEPAGEVVQDFLDILLQALAARGLTYDVVATFTGLDVEFPRLDDSYALEDVRLTDRDVLLVRRDEAIGVSNARSGAFETNFTIPPFFVTLRGWVGADVTVRGRSIRVISTHLDADDADVRLAQAGELFAEAGTTDLPTIIVGDLNVNLNVDADEVQAFHALREAADFDLAAPDWEGAATCCADEYLVDPTAVMDERIDLVLTRGRFRVRDAAVVGGEADAMIDGLWPSDHAGVWCQLRLQ